MFARFGEGIAQNQSPFGISITDLDRNPGPAAQHVSGAKGVARDGIFHRWHQQVQPHRQARSHHQTGQSKRVRRAAHILFHQQHTRRRLDIEPARIEAYAFANYRQSRVFEIAPFEFNHPRCVAAAGGAANHVDHRKFPLERIALGDMEHRFVRFGELRGGGLKLGWSHVFSRRIDQITHQFGRRRLGQNGVDLLDLLGQQNAWRIIGRF